MLQSRERSSLKCHRLFLGLIRGRTAGARGLGSVTGLRRAHGLSGPQSALTHGGTVPSARASWSKPDLRGAFVFHSFLPQYHWVLSAQSDANRTVGFCFPWILQHQLQKLRSAERCI